MRKKHPKQKITKNSVPQLRDIKGSFTAYGKIQVALDYIVRGIDQRKLQKKYQCSITTINHLLRPASIADAVMSCKMMPEVVGQDEISVISSWLKKKGKVLSGAKDPEKTTGESKPIKKQSDLVSSLGSAASVAARGMMLSVAVLTQTLEKLVSKANKEKKEAEAQGLDPGSIEFAANTKELCAIANTLKGLFTTLSPFNAETAEVIANAKTFEVTNTNTQVNITNITMAALLNEIEKKYVTEMNETEEPVIIDVSKEKKIK